MALALALIALPHATRQQPHTHRSRFRTINPILFIVLFLLLSLLAFPPKGTLCLKHIKDKNRDILNESVDGGNVNSIGLGIVMNNGGNIERFLTDKDLLASYYLKASTMNTQLKCCEEQVRNWSATKKMEIQLIGSVCGMKKKSTLSKVNLQSIQFLSLFLAPIPARGELFQIKDGHLRFKF